MSQIAKDKIRTDLLLVERGLAESREKAKALIMAGIVYVNGERAQKPGFSIPASSNVFVKESISYVSRGGLKLEAALNHFNLDVRGLTLLDAGASTGGFTDCLLQRGAEKVIAVDVGYGQFHWKLRNDPRVLLMERKNIRHLTRDDFKEEIHGAVIDVSFISLELVIPPVSSLLTENSFIVALIKPQFEVGKGFVGKGGVVKDPGLHLKVIKRLYLFFEERGFKTVGHIQSPVKGPKGNLEFLIYTRKNPYIYSQ